MPAETGACPVVSVVITTYNRKQIVPTAIDSTLAQDGPATEILVVDDGSSDGTAAELNRRYADAPTVHVLVQENGGPAAARNRGIRAAQGEFVALLDSDDRWRSGYLASQLAVLRATGADLVQGNATTQLGDGSSMALFDRPDWRLPDSMAAMSDSGWPLPSAVVLRASIAKALEFDEAFRLCDDLDFMIRFNEAGYRCVGNPEVLVDYHAHDGQLTADRETTMLNVYRVFKHHSSAHPSLLHEGGPFLDRQFGEILMHRGRPAEAYPHLLRFWRGHPFDMTILRLLLRARVTR